LLVVEDVIASIAPGSKEAQLAAILTSAIDAALAFLPPQNTSISLKASVTALGPVDFPTLNIVGVRVRYNYHGKVKIPHRIFRSRASDFKAAWNAAVKENPALARAKL
jgi:hypothetical protein